MGGPETASWNVNTTGNVDVTQHRSLMSLFDNTTVCLHVSTGMYVQNTQSSTDQIAACSCNPALSLLNHTQGTCMSISVVSAFNTLDKTYLPLRKCASLIQQVDSKPPHPAVP